MNTSITTAAATIALGSVAAALADFPALASLPAAPIFAATAALAILALFVRDYRRTVRPLRVPARLVRPALPADAAAPAAAPRSSAYGVRRRAALVERTAA